VALVNPIIFQVVGYQNSGKTTIITKLIKSLAEKGLKTVTIKHHGHGGQPAFIPQKDTEKHLNAGAIAAAIEGDGSLILKVLNSETSLEDQIELMKFFHPDVILIEGYKLRPFPKLLLIRNEMDLSLIKTVSNVKAIVYWEEILLREITSQIKVPSFHIGDEKIIIRTLEILHEFVHKIDQKS
jgi:molybdopterin-guanine dinucleotide biosynthesis adapter protein